MAYFGHGDVHYSQVKNVVDELERMNETTSGCDATEIHRYEIQCQLQLDAGVDRPRLGRLERVSASTVSVYSFFTFMSYQQIGLERLNETGKLYTVPSKCLDDYYWMLASTSNQSTACDGNDYDMNVPISDSEGRFPGLRPML